MQTANFRDDVVYALANKMGQDPTVDLASDLAVAYVSYINAWVRRLYPNFDWPEWTLIEQRTPNASHYVDFAQASQKVIGRVLKVYLADPDTVDAPSDIAFRLDANGIHCRFEHGTNVWIKYLAPPPQFTAATWSATTNYTKDKLTYSPVSGECYKSKINNNLGHDPSGAATPLPLLTQITQEAIPDDPGTPATPKIMKVTLERLGRFPPLPDPPPNLARFNIKVKDASGTVIASEVVVANGILTKAAIAAQLVTQLGALPALSTFTITASANTVTLQNASDFTLVATYTTPDGLLYPMIIAQLQAYLPAVPPTPGQPQIAVVTITDAQVARDTIFTIGFIDATGTEHTFSYTADVTDSAAQVIQGLATALATASTTDDVLAAVQLSIDLTVNTMTFTTPKQAGVDATYAKTSPFWDYVPFPFEFLDMVVRGAYSDALREDGQTDKATAEEQAVLSELTLKRGAIVNAPYDKMTDQSRPAARYQLPGLAIEGA